MCTDRWEPPSPEVWYRGDMQTISALQNPLAPHSEMHESNETPALSVLSRHATSCSDKALQAAHNTLVQSSALRPLGGASSAGASQWCRGFPGSLPGGFLAVPYSLAYAYLLSGLARVWLKGLPACSWRLLIGPGMMKVHAFPYCSTYWPVGFSAVGPSAVWVPEESMLIIVVVFH